MMEEEIKTEAVKAAAEFIQEQNQKLGLLKVVAAILAVSLFFAVLYSAVIIRDQLEIIKELSEVIGDYGRTYRASVFEMSRI